MARAVRKTFPHVNAGVDGDAFPLWVNVALFVVQSKRDDVIMDPDRYAINN